MYAYHVCLCCVACIPVHQFQTTDSCHCCDLSLMPPTQSWLIRERAGKHCQVAGSPLADYLLFSSWFSLGDCENLVYIIIYYYYYTSSYYSILGCITHTTTRPYYDGSCRRCSFHSFFFFLLFFLPLIIVNTVCTFFFPSNNWFFLSQDFFLCVV